MALSPLPSSSLLLPLFLVLLVSLSLISTVHSSHSYSLRRPIHHRRPHPNPNPNRNPNPNPHHLRPSRARVSLEFRKLPASPRRIASTNRLSLAENSTNSTNSTNSNSNSTNSASSSSRRQRHRARNWVLGFAAGSVAGIASGLALSVLFRLVLNIARGRYRSPSGPAIFSPKVIRRADDLAFLESDSAFAALEIIGRGGCGEVYKAHLPPAPPPSPPSSTQDGAGLGKAIAIKRIAKRSADGPEPTDEESRLLDKWTRQIRSEILTVGHIRHRNLLPLLAHVSRPDCHYLVYEYMKNGSLRDALVDVAEGKRVLPWAARHKIAVGIAAGLEYLHVHHKPQIIHRDLKPANILLDDNLEARIADFGLAKEMPDAHTHMTSSNVAGTVGYIAPEYHQTLKFTAKCDMYSFGVILAALVMGKQPSDDFFQHTEEMSLVKWLRNVMNSPNPTAAIDPTLLGNGFEDQMLLVLRIACFCTADEPKGRPSSKDVRAMLAQIKH